LPGQTLQLRQLSDDQLLGRIQQIACSERRMTVILIAYLSEVDRRKLYVSRGYPSLFAYCTQALKLSEHAAYGRIAAARAGRSFPIIFDMLLDGALNLTGITLLAPHLTSENHRLLLDEAQGRSRKEIEELIVRVRPLPFVPSSIRKLPSRVGKAVSIDAGELPALFDNADTPNSFNPKDLSALRGTDELRPAAPGDSGVGQPTSRPSQGKPEGLTLKPAAVRPLVPLSADCYRLQVTLSRETTLKLNQAKELLRHRIPDGDPARIVALALELLLENVRKQKFGATKRVRRPSHDARKGRRSRNIPVHVRRVVWDRDGARCTYVSPEGVRCEERGRLEFHHIEPFALGGCSTIENIQLRCRTHNVFESEKMFGRKHRSPNQP
jgi:hypothetical protein